MATINPGDMFRLEGGIIGSNHRGNTFIVRTVFRDGTIRGESVRPNGDMTAENVLISKELLTTMPRCIMTRYQFI